ncbi:MAG: phosphopantothenoylcysteine decarboxylase [Verrucomicrobiia bacterium]
MTAARDGAVIITCGPARVRLDEVRCLTNLATGEIGTVLAEVLAERGWRVELFRGAGSTAPLPRGREIQVKPFEAASDLSSAMAERSTALPPVAAVLHAAALNDYELGRVNFIDSPDGASRSKWRSDAKEIELRLVRSPKVLPRLRHWFGSAWIVGWKLELDGGRTEAIAAAQQQIVEAATDGCVVNGRAFGPGFGWLQPGGLLEEAADKNDLARRLASALEQGCRKG